MPATKKKRTAPSDVGNVFNKLQKQIPSPVDFELPDWFNKWKPMNYTFIKRNIYLSKKNKRRQEDDGIFCSCSPGSPSVCGIDCHCGMLKSSCSSDCKCGSSCLNKPFQHRPVKKMRLMETEKCGSGIVADEDIKQGEFVIEYVGEVIDDKTCEKRLWIMKHRGETNFYLCEINRDMVIDATYKGNKSRYINHSCCPNTEMQKWIIDGESRIGIFATCDIKKGDHLTYDYQFVQFGADQDCHCGAVGCREKLGVRPAKPKMSSVAASTCQKTGSLLGELGTEAASTVKKGDGKSKLQLDGSSSFSGCEDLTTGGVNAEIAAIKIQENGVVKTTKVSSLGDPADDGHAEATAMEVEVAGAGISAKTPLHDRPLLLCGLGSENTLEGSSNPGGTAQSPLHEQYLALNVDEMHSRHTTEGLSNGTETAKQQNEVTGRQDESGMTGREHTPHHPFEKKSPFWKMLESMDAFKRFPQQPHFQPLLKIKMVCREGVALGCMLIFSAVVEYTSKLQVDDHSDSMNDILEALVELEQMGFDVKVFQDCLNRLQVMKLRFAELNNKSNEIKRWEVIRGMDVEINDLQEKLREMQAERANMVAKASEISILETEANAINGNIQSVEHDSQTLASAAW